MKTYGGVDVQNHIFFALALIGGEWSASRPDRFTSGERVPGTHRIGGWVDPQSRFGRRGENSCPLLDSNSDHSFVHLTGSCYTDCAILAPY
jgi:hypothetical protein